MFVTTKLATEDQGFQSTQDALKASLERLGLDYVDLYLIHWPAAELASTSTAWAAMMRSAGRRAGEVDRCVQLHAENLSDIIDLTFVTPAVNQIELHPLLNQAELRAVNAEHNIVTEAYSPLGVGNLLDNPAVTAIGSSYDVTPAQVLIRWSLQLGNVVIPRSSSPERIAENFDVFGFELSDADMATLNGLDDGTRFRPNPEGYTGT